MQVTIEVTQADIDAGAGRHCGGGGTCPVALAAKRVFGERFQWVPASGIELKGLAWVPLPQEARNFIRAYDCHREVKPITFTVDVPEEE
jgi:hypothetical protein